jgi:hypothetical protein
LTTKHSQIAFTEAHFWQTVNKPGFTLVTRNSALLYQGTEEDSAFYQAVVPRTVMADGAGSESKGIEII